VTRWSQDEKSFRRREGRQAPSRRAIVCPLFDTRNAKYVIHNPTNVIRNLSYPARPDHPARSNAPSAAPRDPL